VVSYLQLSTINWTITKCVLKLTSFTITKVETQILRANVTRVT